MSNVVVVEIAETADEVVIVCTNGDRIAVDVSDRKWTVPAWAVPGAFVINARGNLVVNGRTNTRLGLRGYRPAVASDFPFGYTVSYKGQRAIVVGTNDDSPEKISIAVEPKVRGGQRRLLSVEVAELRS